MEQVGPYFLPDKANVARAGADLATLRPYFESGQLTTHVHSSFALEDVAQAIDTLRGQGHDGAASTTTGFHGKIVIKVA